MEQQILAIGTMTMGLVAVFAQVGLPSKLKSLTAVLIAIGLSVFDAGFTYSAVTVGIISGLSASGLWSGVQATFKSNTEINPYSEK